MKISLFTALLFTTLSASALAQNITVNVPDGYKIELVPINPPPSQTVYAQPQATYVTPQATYVAPQTVAPAPVVRVAPRARHLASVGEGMIIEHQIDDHH